MNETRDEGFSPLFLDRFQPLQGYRHHLPHWRQESVLYFVTFRLADSIPASVLKAWNDDRRRWLAAHGVQETPDSEEFERLYRAIPPGIRHAYEQEEARRFHGEFDSCRGSCLLRDAAASAIVRDALLFHHGSRLHCGDFVVMPNHVHWIVAPYPGNRLEDVCGSVKRHSAVRINRLAKRGGKLWQHESFDLVVRSANQLEWFRQYVRDNPSKAGFRLENCAYYQADWMTPGVDGTK